MSVIKRPMAILGLGMAIISLIAMNIGFKSSIILWFGMMVIFCVFMFSKKLKIYKSAILGLTGACLYLFVFCFAQFEYINASYNIVECEEFRGVVCETPKESDYAYTYIIDVESKSYKIRYVSKDNLLLKEGDEVRGTLRMWSDYDSDDFIENDLSKKIYFTFFEGLEGGNFLENTGEINTFYCAIGHIKQWFTEIIDTYLPSENGAIAKAMTIGTNTGLTNRILNGFNYSGTVHLLVISGLHITLFSVGILRSVEKISTKKHITISIGLLCLFVYSAVTGFSVSVLRAGLMVGVHFIGKFFDRSADSINSIGIAVVVILLLNPFSTMSAAFWFSVLSTFSILVLVDKVIYWLENKSKYNKHMKNPIIYAIVSNITVSIVTTIFTLPVYIAEFQIIPTAAILANLVMIDLATLLMIFTFSGALLHTVSLTPIAEGIFFIAGLISEFLKQFTDILGFSKWSTMSVSHIYYKKFLLVALAIFFLIFIFKKYSRKTLQTVIISLLVSFLLISTYCNFYYYSVPSIKLIGDKTYPYILLNSKGENTVLGIVNKSSLRQLETQLNIYNQKEIDNIILFDNTDKLPSQLINLYNEFNVKHTFFCFEPPQVFKSRSEIITSKFVLSEDITIVLENSDEFIEILCKDKKIILTENLFENMKEYDIIILYGENAAEIKECIDSKSENTDVYLLSDTGILSLYFN